MMPGTTVNPSSTPSSAVDVWGAGVPVELGPPCARDLAVRNVPQEGMPEGVLGLAADRGAALAPHELLPFEAVQGELHVVAARVAQRGDRA